MVSNAFSTSGLTEYALRILRKTRWGRKQKGQFVYIFKLSHPADQLCSITLAEQRFQKRRHCNRFYQNMMCFPEQIMLLLIDLTALWRIEKGSAKNKRQEKHDQVSVPLQWLR